MSKSTPSLLALLGLVAVAGYQNRAKISDMLADARNQHGAGDNRLTQDAVGRDMSGQTVSGQAGGWLSDVSRMFQGGMGGGSLSNGLNDLVERFKSSGRPAPAESWVADGPNMPMDVEELGAVIGEETLSDLSQKTGMTREQVLLRLNAALPDVVNQFTPNGRIPTEAETQGMV